MECKSLCVRQNHSSQAKVFRWVPTWCGGFRQGGAGRSSMPGNIFVPREYFSFTSGRPATGLG